MAKLERKRMTLRRLQLQHLKRELSGNLKILGLPSCLRELWQWEIPKQILMLKLNIQKVMRQVRFNLMKRSQF